MKWQECAKINEQWGVSRFDWPVGEGKSGFDCEAVFTINDIWDAISWVWTWPGDYFLSSPEVQTFFDMTPQAVVGSWWSTAFVWLVILEISSLGENR